MIKVLSFTGASPQQSAASAAMGLNNLAGFNPNSLISITTSGPYESSASTSYADSYETIVFYKE